jgi:hypothetical protein
MDLVKSKERTLGSNNKAIKQYKSESNPSP